jgi:serine/threonine-protein kinase
VTVQLIDTASGAYLWSEAYDRKMEDLFAIQEEIARAIVSMLPVVLRDRPGAPPSRRGAHNREAHNLYLQGRFHWNKRTADGLELGTRFFEQAIKVDPEFAPAYAGLADSYTLFADYGLSSSAEMMPAAKAAARRALEIDPTLGEAHGSLGMIRSLYDWEWPEAEAHYRRAMELHPGYATARHWFAVDYLGVLGRFDEALEQIEVSMQLDPLSPIISEGKGYILMLARRYEEAVEQYRLTLEMDRYFYKGFTSMGRAYVHMGKYDEAIAMFEKGRSLAGDIPSILSALGQTYAMKGRSAEARRALEELIALSKRRHVHSICFALVHLGMGETAVALDHIEAACRNRELSLAGLKVHPAYDALRDEPRFRAVLRQVGLAPESRLATDAV